MINISKALQIKGWMTEPELVWLAEQATEHKCIVEIGSFLGRSTRALADNAAGVVYAIDDWFGPRDVEIKDEDRKKIFDEFQKNMDGLQGRLHVVSEDHATATIDQSPDMIFIDGDHAYKSVKRDIERWVSFSAPGALLCGHDVYDGGVSLAVTEVFGNKIKIVPKTSIWYISLPLEPFFKRSFGSH